MKGIPRHGVTVKVGYRAQGWYEILLSSEAMQALEILLERYAEDLACGLSDPELVAQLYRLRRKVNARFA